MIELLEKLCVDPGLSFGSLTPRVIKVLYSELQKHILRNYMDKETWLRQCYSVQNGSFQGLALMEEVSMSKFVALCTIHKEAMDQVDNNTPTIIDPGPSVPAL